MTREHPRPPIGKVVVLIPTYNERENLAPIVSRLRVAVADADVVVLDDSSPDGTGEVADKLAADDSQVHVLHRRSKEGSAPPTSPVSPGRWRQATTSWSRWTPTDPTSQSSCRRFCAPWLMPMSRWAHVGCPVVR